MSITSSKARKSARTCLAIVLAAGEGSRMKSARPKVMHEVAGRSMLAHVLAGILAAGADRVAIIVGPGREDVAKAALAQAPGAEIFVQTERRGTAHAVLAARKALEAGCDDLLVVFADTPLIEPATYASLRNQLAAGATLAVLGFEAKDPTGYGRLLVRGGELEAIREHRDATAQERQTTLCNAGLMGIDGAKALAILSAIGCDNSRKEYYLPDAVEIARASGDRAIVVSAPEAEVMGVNDRQQLAAAEAEMQKRLRTRAMREGVTMIAPETVFLSFDTQFGADVLVEPNVFFGPGVTVGEGAVIRASCHFEGATIGPGVRIGPFARLRPGADLGADVKIGNFVEIKAATIGSGTSIAHLSYVGDSSVGVKANIGAGTITCNYDGFDKARCEIGDGAFIGANSALVAPVTIGAGAYVGTGSVITRNVGADALAVARGRQIEKPGWASAFRKSRGGQPKKNG